MYRRWIAETIGLAADRVSAQSYIANRQDVGITGRSGHAQVCCLACALTAPAPSAPVPPDTSPSPIHTNRRCRVHNRYDNIRHCQGAQVVTVLLSLSFLPYGLTAPGGAAAEIIFVPLFSLLYCGLLAWAPVVRHRHPGNSAFILRITTQVYCA